MQIVIEIPKEFEEHFNQDRFKDSFERVINDCFTNNYGLAGNYERETLEMVAKAFEQATPLEAQPTELRDATEEERKSVKNYIESISKPTGVKFDEAFEELDFIAPHKRLSVNLMVQPSEDCISRQAVIDGIDRYIEKTQSTSVIDNFISFKELVIKQLPSVTHRTNLAETSQDCISILNRIMEYTYGMLTSEKYELQHLIKSMMDELSGGDAE